MAPNLVVRDLLRMGAAASMPISANGGRIALSRPCDTVRLSCADQWNPLQRLGEDRCRKKRV